MIKIIKLRRDGNNKTRTSQKLILNKNKGKEKCREVASSISSFNSNLQLHIET